MEGFDGVNDFAEYARSRFSTAVAERQVDITNIGFLDVTLVIDGVSEQRWHNDERFLRKPPRRFNSWHVHSARPLVKRSSRKQSTNSSTE